MSFTPVTSLSQIEQKWVNSAQARTGVALPNCFTYSMARISQIVGYVQPLDNVKVRGAGDLWEGHHPNFTQSSVAQVGALAIFKGGWQGYGHVANVEVVGERMAISQSNYGGPMFEFVEMDKTVGSPYPTNSNLRLAGFLIHKDLPKAQQATPQKVSEKGIVKFIVDEVNVRANDPFNGTVVRKVKNGDTFEYTMKIVGNGHRYVGRKEGSNEVWIAISNSEVHGKDLWVEFVDSEEKQEVAKPATDLIEEDGIATLTVDGIRARLNSPDGDVVRTYNTGQEIRYSYKFVGNGHRYIVWDEGKNKIFLAVSGSETQGIETWATFRTPDENKETVQPSVDYSKNIKGYGVDVSEHNGAGFNLKPYDFVIIRASYGEHKDDLFDHFIAQCELLGKPYGVYHYSYALNEAEAKAETEFFLETIKRTNPTYGCWYDMEDADGYKKKNGALSPENCTKFTKIFCDTVKAKGYYVGVYASASWFGTYVNTDYDKWIADWGTNDGSIQRDASSKAVMLQYTSTPFDKNVSYKDKEYFKSKKEDVNINQPNTEKKDETEVKDNDQQTLIKLLIDLVKKLLGLFK